MNAKNFKQFMNRNSEGFSQWHEINNGELDMTIEQWLAHFNEWLECQRAFGGLTEEKINE